MSRAVRVPWASAPVRRCTRMGCRVRPEMKTSSRESTRRQGRLVRQAASAASGSMSTSCLPPKPPPMRGLITRTIPVGIWSSRAVMRRA